MDEAESAGTSRPSVQAGYMKNLVATLRERELLEAVASRDATLVGEVEAASRLSWLPISVNLRAVDAAAAAFGDERGLDLLADCVQAQFDTPLWRGFVGSAVRLLGRDPGALGRWFPRALQLVFRGCGLWSVSGRADGELLIEARALPRELARHRLWLRSLAHGAKPVFSIAGTDGTSELVHVDPDAGTATIRLAWKAAAER